MSLYEQDFWAWCRVQAQALRSGHLAGLDLVNLADEIEEAGQADENELLSRLEVLFIHLLKWRFQPARRGRSWRLSIAEQRRKIARRLETARAEMATRDDYDAVVVNDDLDRAVSDLVSLLVGPVAPSA